MRSLLMTTLTVFAVAGAAVRPAAAQDNTILKPARLELGANFITMTGDVAISGGPQLAFSFKPRHAVQVSADLSMDQRPTSWKRGAFYSVQYRYTLPMHSAKTRIFLTVGGVGYFGWTHYDAYTYTFNGYSYVLGGQTITIPAATYNYPARTYFTGWPPVLPAGGIGFQHALTNRIAVRADVSAVAGLGWWVGMRASAGIVMPLGRTTR